MGLWENQGGAIEEKISQRPQRKRRNHGQAFEYFEDPTKTQKPFTNKVLREFAARPAANRHFEDTEDGGGGESFWEALGVSWLAVGLP